MLLGLIFLVTVHNPIPNKIPPIGLVKVKTNVRKMLKETGSALKKCYNENHCYPNCNHTFFNERKYKGIPIIDYDSKKNSLEGR
jgi:hypothetical protein